MKSCAVLATVLFGLCAVAAPVNKRALYVHTELVIETVVVTSTVYQGDEPAATPTPAGEFYGKPAAPAAQPTYPAPAPVAAKPSSAHAPAPAPQKPTTAPTSASVAPAPEPAKPTSSAPAYVAPAPVPEPAKPSSAAPSYVAPAPKPEAPKPEAPKPEVPAAPASGASTSSGESYSNVDITIYQTAGAAGACGTTLNDNDMIVAIAQPAWGASTYDVMTGNATNRWCGKKVQIEYKGKTVQAKIMDMCPGCTGHDLDLSPAVWKALTGSDEMTRYKASWHLIN